MTQANEPNDSDRDRWGSSRAFDRGYDEIDSLEEQVDRRFDRLENEVREMRAELNGKIDIIMRHITGL